MRPELVQRRNSGEGFLEAGEGFVLSAPGFDIVHVEGFRPLDRDNIAGVVEVFVSTPAKFLHDDIFGGGEPGFAIELDRKHSFAAPELGENR